jgi:hypothetical protein
MSLTDTLHDMIDEQERLGEQAKLSVEEVRAQMLQIIENADSTEEGLELIAELVADSLAAITTEAVQSGRDFGKRVV